jgi:hypothetical protein
MTVVNLEALSLGPTRVVNEAFTMNSMRGWSGKARSAMCVGW